MKHRWMNIAIVVGFAASAIVVAGNASAHPTVNTAATIAPPTAALSSSGDYATDVLGDPWDFSNDEDVPPLDFVGTEGSFGISRSLDGMLHLDGRNGSIIKLVRIWGAVLPWGHDGLLRPIDASVYTRLSFQVTLPGVRDIGVRYYNEAGQFNDVYQFNTPAGTSIVDLDLTGPGQRFGPSLWSGKITRLDLIMGGARDGAADRFQMSVDWVRLRRANAPVAPDNSPIVKMISPSEEGGDDYATVSGNPWDFAGFDDIVSTGDITNGGIDGTAYNGTTFANDSFVELPLRTPLNTDRYHRATVDVCYDGLFSLADAPGGGMNARFAWFDEGGQTWSETQDIVIYPGCNKMSFDLATDPAAAVNDEGTVYKAGWRGLRITRLRFDLNEDRGFRNFSLRDIKLADDAAFSTSYGIQFNSSVGGTADIFATTAPGAFTGGTQIASGVKVVAGTNTSPWNGNDLAGNAMPNGTYWVYTTVHNANNTAHGSAYSTGPVRIERPVGNTSSYFVPLNPARLLDTRTGAGGNISALSSTAMTELKVTGFGGVQPGATAVVLNVTVDAPATSGFITAWPSGEAIPTVSNLNFVAGQTVPNLVTVKIGANGRVNLYNSEGSTHLIADVVGYYQATRPTNGGLFNPLTPKRLLDTREGLGAIPGGQSINLTVTGGVTTVPPTGVSGVALNVTVDQPTGPGYLTVWPTGDVQPLASSHNFVAGLTVANLVLAKVGANGQVSIFNSFGSTHVVVDVVGFFSATGTGQFVPVSPQRIVDSRFGIGTGVNGPLGQGAKVDVAVAGVVPGSAGAKAAIVNVTSVNSSLPSFITVWPTGDAKPTASTVNPRPGLPIPNLAYLKLGSGGQLSIFNNTGSTDYIVDVFGYVI
jgi:hypothetical protein